MERSKISEHITRSQKIESFNSYQDHALSRMQEPRRRVMPMVVQRRLRVFR